MNFWVKTVSKPLDMEFKDESQLITGLRQGNERAFQVLIRRYQRKLYGIAYGITLDREESLDIVQEIFLKVYQKIHMFRKDASLSTWLRRITINESLNWRRKWKRRFKWQHRSLERDNSSDYPELATPNNPETYFREKEIGEILAKGLEALTEEARTVFVLKEMEGLSYDDIAKVMGLKRGTVSSRLFYAREKLRASLRTPMEVE
jgi:RNA polymerase sigma-70 factor (ECF subfamily)